MSDYMATIKSYNKSTTKKLKKLGTIAVDIVETTPVVWENKLYRFEWQRNFNAREGDRESNASVRFAKSYFHFVNMETGEETSPFAHKYRYGSAYTENGTMYVVGTTDFGSNAIDLFISKDLTTWEKKNIITMPKDWKFYNNSICKSDDGYIMAIEVGAPSEISGVGFSIIFAHSKNLLDWEILDTTKYLYTKERYSACPVIRYSKGYYYMIYLEAMPMHKFVPYIVRSADLLEWEVAPVNPVLYYNDEDKILLGDFSKEEKEWINCSLNINNSDVDLCEYKGKTIILYSWGNQFG